MTDNTYNLCDRCGNGTHRRDAWMMWDQPVLALAFRTTKPRLCRPCIRYALVLATTAPPFHLNPITNHPTPEAS